MNNKARLLITVFAVVTAAAIFIPVASCSDGNEPASGQQGGGNNNTGNTGSGLGSLTVDDLLKVKTNPTSEEFIQGYEGFTVSFNPSMHLPNWVAWAITLDHLNNSTVTRNDNFRADTRVPGCATLSDYRGSGYDRGHMAPAADMKWSEKAMDESFYLTNMCPQIHDLNAGAWEKLESKCRDVGRRDTLALVVCGPVLTQGFTKYIGNSPVPVPPSFFKVILVPGGKAGPQGIGFIMPNSYVEGGMQATAVTIDEVERLTGHDFFYMLDDATENRLESMNDFNRFSTGKISARSGSRP